MTILSRLMLLNVIVAAILFPFAASAQTDPVDLTSAFIQRGAAIGNFSALQISGIVILRGTTSDRTRADEVRRIATTLGLGRVANLIVVVDRVKSDAAIVRAGRRQLDLERELDGCRLHIDSSLGVVRLTGYVLRTAQADLAATILGKIDGVKTIQRDLDH